MDDIPLHISSSLYIHEHFLIPGGHVLKKGKETTTAAAVRTF